MGAAGDSLMGSEWKDMQLDLEDQRMSDDERALKYAVNEMLENDGGPRRTFSSSDRAIILAGLRRRARFFEAGLEGTPTTRMQRIGSWSALVIPSKRRKEMVGDFLESIQSGREQGFGWFGLRMLIAAKCLLYAWVVLKLRIGDLAHQGEDAESPESPD